MQSPLVTDQPTDGSRQPLFPLRCGWTGLIVLDATWVWVLMLLFHESGHVITAWLTGGAVQSTNLFPGALGHTFVEPNPAPNWVVWGGFLAGSGAPLLLLAVGSQAFPSARQDLGLLAGFCLFANGAYLAAGGGETLTDTGALIALGWPHWLLVVLGILLAIPGYLLCRRCLVQRFRDYQSGQFSPRNLFFRGLGLVIWVSVQARLLPHE